MASDETSAQRDSPASSTDVHDLAMTTRSEFRTEIRKSERSGTRNRWSLFLRETCKCFWDIELLAPAPIWHSVCCCTRWPTAVSATEKT